jgi:hypothetical protein
MAKFAWIAGIVLVAGAALAFAMSKAAGDKVYSWRCKMTVTVETPEGVNTGSTVRQVDITKKLILAEIVTDPSTGKPKVKEHYKFDNDITGEAVVVDLGERGVLFALIDWFDYNDVPAVFNTPKYADVVDIPLGSKAQVTNIKYWPDFVTFTDMNEPKSVTRVLDIERCLAGTSREEECKKAGPHVVQSHAEEFFGKGVKIKGITLEITDEPVTWGIEERLPWLWKLNGGYLHGGTTSRGAPLGLHGGNFRRGESK